MDDDEPNDGDKALLERLNALKQSNIKFDSSKQLPTNSTQRDANITSDLHDITSDLTARFKKLHSTGSPSVPSTSNPGLGQSTDEEEQSIEELLAELGPEDQWTLHQYEETNINALLEEARKALPQGPQKSANQDVEEGRDRKIVESSNDGPANESSTKPEIYNFALEDEEQEDKNDDQQADEYLQKLLDELSNEPPEDEPSSNIEAGMESSPPLPTHATHTDSFRLPSKPSNIPTEDSSELSLPSAPSNALSLPSTPSSAPKSKKTIKGSKKECDYSEEDIATWCTICNDDATVKCVGCEGDLYCVTCWRETHTGFEESGHRWVKYLRR